MRYTSPTKAMKHQSEYLRALTRRPSRPSNLDVMAVLGEQGTGKSKMVLDEWSAAVGDGHLKDIFVVSRAGSYRNWFEKKTDDQLSEFETHLDPRLYKSMFIAPWVTGGGVERRRRLEYMLTVRDRPRALIMNVEALSSTDEAYRVAREFLQPGRALFAIDESTIIRNKRAERTKAIMKLRDLAPVRRILTGLVTPKSPLDLYWQFAFLDWRILGFESPLGFRDRYAVIEKKCYLPNDVIRGKLFKALGLRKNPTTKQVESPLPDARLRYKLVTIREHFEQDYSRVPKMPREDLIRKLREEHDIMRRDDMIDLIPKIGGYVQVVPKIKEFRHLEELNGKIAPYSFRVLKKDCLDLKPKIFEPRDVELTEEQRRLYREIRANATAMLESGDYVVTKAVIDQMIRLHQIVCGHVVDEEGKVHDVPSNRVAAVLETLEEHEGKAIIWTAYRHEVRKIAAALAEEYGEQSVALFYGGNKGTRVADEKRFLGEKECRFMISTPQTGGFGNTWNVANLTIYAANTYDLELRSQSEDRNHRKGQRLSVTYVDLVARGTVEEKIIKVLRHKIDMAAVITGDNFREWLI